MGIKHKSQENKENVAHVEVPDYVKAAFDYLVKGDQPVPLYADPETGKLKPRFKWKEEVTAITEADVATWFAEGCSGIALRTGTRGNGLIDIDLDCAEAVQLAPTLLPDTDCVFGRPGKARPRFDFVNQQLEEPRAAASAMAH